MALEETVTLEKERGGEFRLKSAIQHFGGTDEQGHYISFIKDNTGQWWKADDSNVTM